MRILQRLFMGALAAVMVTVTFPLAAQSTVGTVYGTVTDVTGAAIPAATIVITDTRTTAKQTAFTNARGEYTFTAVLPSDYTASATASGFKTENQTGITVSSNQNVHVIFGLQTGSVTESVEVEAGVTLVDTRETQLADTIDQQKIQDLPTVNRETYSLLQTVTGVQGYDADQLTGSRNGTKFSVNGFPNNTPSFYLDGAYNNAFKGNGGNKAPNPDMLQEFRVITSNFDAEFGRSPGAVVNLISRSGGNHYHGSAYEYIRNDAFDARNFFSSAARGVATKAPLKQHQFGATFGGRVPVLKNTFFFIGWEHLLNHGVATANGLNTLTAAERTGDFSGESATNLTAIGKINGGFFKTATGTNCPTKYVVCNIDPVAKNLLQFIPTFGGSVQQLRASSNTSEDMGIARIDYKGFANHTIYGTFFNAVGGDQVPGAGNNNAIGLASAGIPQYSGMIETINQLNAVIADDWVINPRTVNSVRGFYTYNRFIIANQITNHFFSDLGSGTPVGGTVFAPPQFAVSGFFTIGPNNAGPSDITQLSFGLVDTATLTRGRHSIKVGASWNSNKYTEDGNGSANGVFTFTAANTGFALSDFLTGQANTLLENGGAFHRTRQQDPAVFAQDDWQITKRLNLNVGLRYEVYQAYVGDSTSGNVVIGQQSTVIPGAPAGILVTGDKGVPDGGYSPAYNRFAPRVGMAFDAFGDGRTSLRAGYGIFYNQFIEDNINALTQEPYQVAQTTNTPPNLVCPYGGTFSGGTCAGANTPFPFTFSKQNARFYTNTTLTAFRPGEKSTPYANEFNLSLEQQLSRFTALRVSFVGATYMKQYIALDLNTPVFFPGASTNENPNATPTTALPYGNNGLNCRRPYQPYRTGGVVNAANCQFNNAAAGGYTDAQGKLPLQFAGINQQLPINNQSYNSLQVELRGKVKQLNFQSSYVWGKALNYTTPTVDQTDIRKNRGAADIDLRNRFTFSATYRLPSVKRYGFVGKQVLSGWNLNDITILQSGSPFTVQSQVDTNRDGNVNDRVNIVGLPFRKTSGHLDIVQNGFLNNAAFVQPCGAVVDATCTNPYGNEQRNSLYTVADYRSNVSAFKEFAIYEQLRFQFRAEAFNLFNFTHLTGVRNNLPVLQTQAAITTGTATFFQSADAPRRLQFAAKILF